MKKIELEKYSKDQNYFIIVAVLWSLFFAMIVGYFAVNFLSVDDDINFFVVAALTPSIVLVFLGSFGFSIFYFIKKLWGKGLVIGLPPLIAILCFPLILQIKGTGLPEWLYLKQHQAAYEHVIEQQRVGTKPVTVEFDLGFYGMSFSSGGQKTMLYDEQGDKAQSMKKNDCATVWDIGHNYYYIYLEENTCRK